MDAITYATLSFFSGGLGMDLGLHRTGRFRLLACADISRACCQTIRLNRDAGRVGDPGLVVYEGDVSRLSPERIMADLGLRPGDLDLLVGCPPCQSYSIAGKGLGIHDPRGLLLWEVYRFADVMQPRVFLMENVPGLLTAALNPSGKESLGRPLRADERPGSIIRAFFADLPDGYRVDCFVINALNYGVSQCRERVILIGNRLNALTDFPEPTHGRPDQPPYRTLRDALEGLVDPDPVVMPFSPRILRFLSQVPSGGNWRSLDVEDLARSFPRTLLASGGRSHWFYRPALDRPCPTVLTTPCSMYTTFCHPTELRAFSVRELARVQGFQDDFEFAGRPAKQYMQVGNAVPPRLGEICGTIIARLLDETERGVTRNEKHPRWRIVQLRSHIRLTKNEAA